MLTVVGVAAAACQSSSPSASQGGPASSNGSPPTPVTATAKLAITPASGAARVKPASRITVRAANASLVDVTVRGGGIVVHGHPAVGAGIWRSSGPLQVSTRYTVRATAVDPSGKTVTAISSFRTLTPTRTVRATIFEGQGQVYGVGMPIILSFDVPVVNKAAVERALEITSSKPVVGAWYWDGDSTLYFRPRNYWPAHTTVRFVGNLNGVETAPGVYADHTLTQTFQIGRSLIAVASTVSHKVLIYRDGRLFATWPISSGKPGDDTPNGTYLTIEKHNPVEMKGPGYDLMVPWSVRFTWSGDYLHDAYWSVGQQGFSNVSHGCVNLSPANAQTYYMMSVPGDPVTITDSPRGGVWGNGWTVWFLTWKQYVRGSALHRALRVGPHGSTPVDPASLPAGSKRSPLGAPAPGNPAPA
jgi:lipoprotein-anchoring transpeptidase ErfK/SrfK